MRERLDALTYVGVGRVVALEAGQQLTGCRGVAAPEAYVGEGDPAVVVVRALFQQPDEAAVRGGEIAGPALQLGDPEAVFEAARVFGDYGAIGIERLGQALLSAELLGLAAEVGCRALGNAGGRACSEKQERADRNGEAFEAWRGTLLLAGSWGKPGAGGARAMPWGSSRNAKRCNELEERLPAWATDEKVIRGRGCNLRSLLGVGRVPTETTQNGRPVRRRAGRFTFIAASAPAAPVPYSFFTFSAAGPFCPCTMSNSTLSPSARLLKPCPWIAL
jgi:hypothetical protein